MTTKSVQVNYTEEQSQKMVQDYQSGVTVEMIAQELGKSARSVIAKLSREKVYVAKVAASKTGEAVIKKDQVADAIALLVGLSEPEAESLTKANKTALKKIFDCLPK
jgi:response regulator RpfG family c-di-GMP phosphodiesterase